jgi:hypothetical protein
VKLAASLGGMLLALCAQADDSAGGLRASVEQKLAFVERLLEDEGMARRVVANERARSEFAAAYVHLARARERLRAGDAEGGGRAADQALQAVTAARRLAPDQALDAAAERARYERRLQSLESLLAALRGEQARSGAKDTGELERAAAILDAARRLAADGAYDKASHALHGAESLLGASLDRVLTVRTVDYTPRFASRAEEFRHQLERHGALRELIGVAVARYRPGAQALAAVESHKAAAAGRREFAEQLAARGEMAAALDALAEATAALERALAAAGVSLPTPQ